MRGHFLARRHKQHGYNMIRSGVLLIDWQHARYLRLRLRYCYYSLRSLRSKRPRPRQKPRMLPSRAQVLRPPPMMPGFLVGWRLPRLTTSRSPLRRLGMARRKLRRLGMARRKLRMARRSRLRRLLRLPAKRRARTSQGERRRIPRPTPPASSAAKKSGSRSLAYFVQSLSFCNTISTSALLMVKCPAQEDSSADQARTLPKVPGSGVFVRGAAGLCSHLACIFRLSSTFVRCWAWKVHWWKYVLANMDLAVCGTDQEIETRVDELMGLYVVPYEQKLHTGP